MILITKIRHKHMTKKAVVKKSVGSVAKVGAVVAGVAAVAAAGYYFFYGSKEGALRRKKVTVWSKKLKAEVVAEARKLKVANKKAVADVVKRVSKAYGEMKSIDRKDLALAVKELQSNWEAVKQEAEKTIKVKAAGAKKVAKAVKKALK